MTFLAKQRSLETFYQKTQQKSDGYRKNVKYTLENNFAVFCKEQFGKSLEEVMQEMKRADEDAVFDTIQEWINWNNKPNSIRAYFSHLKNYLYYRGIKMTSMDTKLNLVFGRKQQEEHYPLPREDLEKILKVASYPNRALYLLMVSSGMRPVEAIHIRKQDIEIDKRLIFHVPAKWTKLKRAKTTFCSKEATALLMPIIKRKKSEETLFGSTNTGSVDVTFKRYCEKLALDKKTETGRNKISPMSLRAYFITKISRHDPNLAKKWAGQLGYLLQYDRMNTKEMLDKYLEFEADLLIDPNEKLKAENERLLQDQDKVKVLEQQMDRMQKQLERTQKYSKA